MLAPGHMEVNGKAVPCQAGAEVRRRKQQGELAITGMLVGNGGSLNCGTSTLCSERLEREGVLIMKSKGKCVLIEQDEPFQERRGTGRRKQKLPFFFFAQCQNGA